MWERGMVVWRDEPGEIGKEESRSFKKPWLLKN